MTVWGRVARRAAWKQPISVACFGAGYVGHGLAHVLDRLPGFRPAAIVNRSVERAVDAYVAAGHRADEVVIARDDATLQRAVEQGAPVVTSDPDLAIACDGFDVFVEATGALGYGAEVMLAALRAGRAVVSINAEVDLAVGWLLHVVAAEYGGVYTICDGDQPGVQMRTVDRVTNMGFDVVASMNCKRHLDVHQSIATSMPYAERDGTSVAVTVSAGDGTKLNIEQAVVANLASLIPERRGMRGIPTVLERALGDVLAAISRDRVVDYTLGGDFGAGVFVIARVPEPDVVRTPLRFYKLGDGPEYLVFNPYTLVQFEMPRSIAEVVLDEAPLWSPLGPPVADVVAVAKRDLAAGDRVDGIGGDACYGQVDTLDNARGLLPVVLADHARVVAPVPRDEPIPLHAVELDADAPIVVLRRMQDEILGLMRFAETPIPGAWVITLEPIADERGFFARTFCADEFAALGIDPTVVQCNMSLTHAAGTIRGMHYQVAPAAETKLVRVARGAIHDVIVDLRADTPTYLHVFAVELSEENQRSLFVPAGCAHGFQTLADETCVAYQMGAPYTPGTDRGLRYDDPGLAIVWPRPVVEVSARDRAWPLIADRSDLQA